uniref:Uncharacterized protein n=1 Tax=viral metagenome TaxID=1070528 RepID=A0A6C0I733_9ZZZZ
MSYQRPKWQSYTLPSWERPNILRDPPKSIHTKKKERVEMGDVSYMIRNDDSRINEGISYLARGVNPMVDVSYSNYGGNGAKLTTMATPTATNPYKVIKDGAFRPPIMTQEDLLPLSRMRRPETSATTNPGISTLAGFVTPNLQNNVDLATVSNAIDVKKINYLSIRPSATFNISLPIDVDVFGNRAIQKNKLQFAHYANPSTNLFDVPDYLQTTNDRNIVNDAINQNNLKVQNVTSNPNLKVYIQQGNDLTEVQGSVKDKLNIAVQTRLGKPITINREDGTHIKIKDYISKVVQTNVNSAGGDAIILRVNNNENTIKLERNMPLYATSTNISPGYQKQYDNTGVIELDSKLQTSAMSNINDRTMTVSNKANEYDYETQSASKARGMGYIGGIVDTASGISRYSGETKLPDFNNVRKLALAY